MIYKVDIIRYFVVLLTCTNIVRSWNPKVDECNVKLFGYECKSTINGNAHPVEKSIIDDVEQILVNDNKRFTMEILSKRNFLQRNAIKKLYFQKHPNKHELYEHFQESKEQPADKRLYSELLLGLLLDVHVQSVLYLWTIASMPAQVENNPDQEMHDSTLFIIILGGTSNNGLQFINSGLKQMGDPNHSEIESSIENQMRNNGKYPEKFIKLIMKLLEGKRKETIEIDEQLLAQDYTNLKEQFIDIVEYKRDENEDFLCDLLTQRSFPHLKQLFSKTELKKFDDVIIDRVHDNVTGRALLELFYITTNRIRWYSWILSSYHETHFFTTFLLVTRSEIDLGNIKEFYEKEAKQTMSQMIKGRFSNINEMYATGLINLIDPPAEISSQTNSKVENEEDENSTYNQNE